MKTNRTLAKLLIADLVQFQGMKFKYADRLTKAEAEGVIAWAKGHPEVRKAYGDRGSPHFEMVRTYAGMINHFAAEHPSDAAGEPAPWPHRPEPQHVLPDDNPFESLHPDDAEARLTWARTRPEYWAAYRDKNHPQHADYVRQTQQLIELQHSGTAAADRSSVADYVLTDEDRADAAARVAEIQRDPAYLDAKHRDHAAAMLAMRHAQEGVTAPPRRSMTRSTAEGARARISELRGDPAYLDKRDPDHAARVREMTDCYEALYPSGAQAAAPATAQPQSRAAPRQAPAIANPHARIKELQAHPAYADRAHPEHKDTVAAMTQAYQAAYPEPADSGG